MDPLWSNWRNNLQAADVHAGFFRSGLNPYTGSNIPRKTSGRRISTPRQNGHIQVTGEYDNFVLGG